MVDQPRSRSLGRAAFRHIRRLASSPLGLSRTGGILARRLLEEASFAVAGGRPEPLLEKLRVREV